MLELKNIDNSQQMLLIERTRNFPLEKKTQKAALLYEKEQLQVHVSPRMVASFDYYNSIGQ